MKTFFLFLILILTFSCTNQRDNSSNSIYINNQQLFTDSIKTVKLKDSLNNIDSIQNVYINEVIDGWLSEGIDQNILIKKLGNNIDKGNDESWEATGTYIQEWNYASIGVFLNMESNNLDDIKRVYSIRLKKPCTYKTSKGILIGSDKNDILQEYKNSINYEESDDKYIVVGYYIDCIIFTIENNKVSEIFIGPAAE
jgi:hypothetical protein